MLPVTTTAICPSPILGGTTIAVRRGAAAPFCPSNAATLRSDVSPPSTRSWASTPSALAMRLSQPTETVRVPVSSRPIVWGVVGGSHCFATSSSVMPRALRTSLIRVIIAGELQKNEPIGFFYCPTVSPMWQVPGNYILDKAHGLVPVSQHGRHSRTPLHRSGCRSPTSGSDPVAERPVLPALRFIHRHAPRG